MFIGNFGNAPSDDRPQLLLGLTPDDIGSILAEGGRLYVNASESQDEPLPIHLILVIDESNEAIEGLIEKVMEHAKSKGAENGQDDV